MKGAPSTYPDIQYTLQKPCTVGAAPYINEVGEHKVQQQLSKTRIPPKQQTKQTKTKMKDIIQNTE